MQHAHPTPTDEAMMDRALAEASAALDAGKSGIAALLHWRGEVLASGINMFHATGDRTDHAEMVVLHRAARRLSAMNEAELAEVTLYTTLEPCLMCLSAISIAGIKRVVYAAHNDDGSDAVWVARGITTAQINPLLVRGALALVPGVRREAGVRLLERMGIKA